MQVSLMIKIIVFWEFLSCQIQALVSTVFTCQNKQELTFNLDLLNYTLSPTRFSALDWIDQLDESGIIAGGMEDGAITLWSASKILETTESNSN